MRERRCEQQQDILDIDKRQVEQQFVAVKTAEAVLAAERSFLQAHETELVVQA